MKWTLMALGAAVVLLLAADLLAFHDLFEPHTGTDWLMATATILAAVSFIGLTADRWRVIGRSR